MANTWCNADSLKIYVSHTLSSWGDRMWGFAVGLYLIILYPTSLQLTATYGLSSCISVIIFGATLGRWIDKTKRITVARVAVVVQNVAVVSSSLCLIVLLYFKTTLDLHEYWSLKAGLIASVIVLAVIANLGSEASKIALEKDWIVVLSAGDEIKLANMNATMRSIDLTTYILAPILVGQIISYVSQIAGAGFMACWNILSGFCEYGLLTHIYNRVPELSKKKVTIEISSPDSAIKKEEPAPSTPITYIRTDKVDTDLTFDELAEISLASPNTSLGSWNPFMNKVHPQVPARRGSKNCCVKTWSGLKQRCKESLTGWRDYFAHPVCGAGIGLALLYMTVLGFDSVTTGYAYSQGVSESLLGIMTAMGALFGILGSVSFPYIRKKLGNCKTGILGFGLETYCLVLCLVSIVAPGSPFVHKNFLLKENATLQAPNASNNATNDHHTSLTPSELWSSRMSVVILMAGIILARYGLWIADLSVIQIFQEEVPEDKRGVLNGVQGSLNQGMNLLKFIIVIILPNPDTFAYLISLSWIFVFAGWISFIVFTCKFGRLQKVKDREQNIQIEVAGVTSTALVGVKDDVDNNNRMNNN